MAVSDMEARIGMRYGLCHYGEGCGFGWGLFNQNAADADPFFSWFQGSFGSFYEIVDG